jgi:nitroreductase
LVDVYDAVDSRRAVRAFSAEPVPKPVLERVLTAAARAPSSGNLQPWQVYVVTGEPLADLKRRATARALAGDPGDEREYPMYPADLVPPYLDRFSAAAAQRYAALGIERDDPARPVKISALNSAAFGAPVVLFCYLDRTMGPGQWADAGMYLQTVMLLLRAEGLHSCTQEAWAEYHRSVAAVICPPPQRMLFCGMSIGYAEPAVAHPRIRRAPLSETLTFID